MWSVSLTQPCHRSSVSSIFNTTSCEVTSSQQSGVLSSQHVEPPVARRRRGSVLDDVATRFAAVHSKQQQELQELMGSSKNLWQVLPLLALALSFPLACAVRMIGVNWALQRTTFSVATPPIVASLLQALGVAVLLCARHGLREIRPTSLRASATVFSSAMIGGMATSLTNISAGMAPAGVVTALLQTSTLFSIGLQYFLMNITASMTQMAAVMAVICIALAYTFEYDSGAEDSTGANLIGGVCSGVGAALAFSLYGVMFEMAERRSSELTAVAGGSVKAEQLRSLLVASLGMATSSSIIALMSDLPFLMEHGVFGGWTLEVLLAAAVTLIFTVVIEQMLFMTLGSTLTRIVSTLQIFFVYFLDLIVSPEASFSAADQFLLSALVGSCCIYNFCALDVQIAVIAMKKEHAQEVGYVHDNPELLTYAFGAAGRTLGGGRYSNPPALRRGR